jgi:H+/Cl- antiporter ClcA
MQQTPSPKHPKRTFADQWRFGVGGARGVLRSVAGWVEQGIFWPEISKYLSRHSALQAGVYWLAATAAGLVAVLYAEAFEGAALLCQVLLRDHPWFLFSIGPFCFVLSRWMVTRFAPAAAGSGIPHVMAACAVDPPHMDSWVGFRIAVVKILSSLVALVGGGSMGREGPTIQISASIFYGFGSRFRGIWPNLNHHSLLIAGGAAGIAAAFNTPLGGIVYAIEELSHRNFHRFKTMLISAVIIAGLVAQGLQGPYLYFGFPKLPLVTASLLPWALGIGLFVGLLGGLFGKFLHLISKQLGRWQERSRLWLAFGMGILLPLTAWWVGPMMISGGSDLILHLLFDDEKQISWGLVAARFFAPLATYSTGVASGMFAPGLAAGAAIGAKIAQLTHAANANFIILLGMIAFLSGVTRAPFTSFVLVMEMTDRHSAIFAMMVASLVASLAAKIIDSKSFYERSAARLIRTLPKSAQPKRRKKAVAEEVPPIIPHNSQSPDTH